MADVFALILKTHIIVSLIIICILATPTKAAESCDNAPVPEYGSVAKLELIADTKVAWYECDNGYKLDGMEFRVCMPGRGWSGWVKCLPPPTTPTTTLSPEQKEVKAKIKNLVHDVEEVGQTTEGQELMVAIGVSGLLLLLLAIHCGRTAATRKSLKTKYDEVLKSGNEPRKELPSLFTVSNDIFKTTFCCQDSNLPKSFKPKKDKKRNREETDEIRDETNENQDFRSNHNMNSRSMQIMRSREKHFRPKVGRHGDTWERCPNNRPRSHERQLRTDSSSEVDRHNPSDNRHFVYTSTPKPSRSRSVPTETYPSQHRMVYDIKR